MTGTSSPASRTERTERAGRWLARVFLSAGAVILTIMLALTLIDVAGRYLLLAPVNGKTELTRILMAGLIACALPVITVSREQITVDLLDRFFHGRVALVRDLAVDLITTGALITIAYWILFRADRLYKRGYVSDFLGIPLYPVAYFIATMVFIAALALLAQIALGLARRRSGA